MDIVVAYFENIPSFHRGLILAGGIGFFWFLENAFPFLKMTYNKTHHAFINIFFTLTTIVINFLMAFLLIYASQWVTQNQWGILNYIPETSVLGKVVIGLLMLDLFGAYLPHWIEHKIKFFWRFHLIHHTDTWVDTTTANRHHPGESVLRFIFTVLGVVMVGAPMWLVFLYQSLSVVFSQFNHANINLPKKIDVLLSWVIVSPDMHKVHHHYQLPFTDSNYGNIFSVWDRLFGTFLTLEREKLIYGIDTHPDEKEHNDLKKLLKLPFQPLRKPTHLP